MLVLSAGVAAAGSALYALTPAESAYDTMGSGGDEWSGATYNADRNVLLVVDDENIGYEFGLNRHRRHRHRDSGPGHQTRLGPR